MKKRNERTWKRIATIAGRILAIDPKAAMTYGNTRCHLFISDRETGTAVSWDDVRALAGSALTQAEDRSHVMRSGKLPRNHKRIKSHPPVRRAR